MDLVEAVDHLVICARLRLIAGPERKKCLHLRLFRRIELSDDVGDEDDLV